MKNIEIIALIYKSVAYLNFIYDQLKSDHCKVPGWDIKLRIVANDATPAVLERLRTLDIPYTVYNDLKLNDYYLNRVYRCWNYAGYTSQCDNICFVNSDMAFSVDWLKNLLKHHDGVNIPCSRLIESGKMPSGKYGISYNVGKHPSEFDTQKWNTYVKQIKQDSTHPGGLFMPCVFETKRFIKSGMYPEGNIYADGQGTLSGPVLKSGDAHFFYDVLEKKFGMKHITVFDSVVYHIQEGEMDD